ncbi:hypothetical protein LP420_02250 [Massilia sp. B-10]|nr:hypothetical protein LP420_02250 [Massilia sp. B-10]
MVSASPTELKVITALDIVDGPVKVTVGTHSATGPVDFDVTGYPDAGAGEDGPPISFAWRGRGRAGRRQPDRYRARADRAGASERPHADRGRPRGRGGGMGQGAYLL